MKKIRVLVAGLPGKMATLIAEAIKSQDDMELLGHALAESNAVVTVGGNPIELISTENHEKFLESYWTEIDLVVDFTQPRSVNRNAQLYCENQKPFVIGTTGGDRQKLIEVIKNYGISAVVATNMAVPVVMFQGMMRFAAENFKNSLEGFKLKIRESHQASKPDPSGTAVGLLEYFAALGVPLKPEQIIMIRNPIIQEQELGVPPQHLGGHGYHTYTLRSPDKTVVLEFTHNIVGRNVYVDGALKAIRFLAAHRHEKGKVFSMFDVLRG